MQVSDSDTYHFSVKIIAKMWDFQPHEITNQVWEEWSSVFFLFCWSDSTSWITWITKIPLKVQKRKITHTIGWGCVFNEMLFFYPLFAPIVVFLFWFHFFQVDLFPIICGIYKASYYKDFIITRSRLEIWFIPNYKRGRNLKCNFIKVSIHITQLNMLQNCWIPFL